MARRSRAYVELEGQEDMRRAFARLQFGVLAKVKEQIRESAEVIERGAKARLVDQTDVEAGKTLDSIRVIYYDAGMAASIGSGYFNARFKEQGTQHEPARPFLNPAFQQERGHYLAGVEDALNTAGKEAGSE